MLRLSEYSVLLMQNNAFLPFLHKYSFALVKLPEGLGNTPRYLYS